MLAVRRRIISRFYFNWQSGPMRRSIALAVMFVFLASFAVADEGLWLFNAPPKDKIKTRYGFVLTDDWLAHLRESSVRFNNGGSGSFVSPEGLAFTNHHIASDCLSKLSTSEKDYIRDGFYAKSRAEEAKCPDLELNVLVGIEDVTGKVNGAVQPGMTAAAAGNAQRAAMSSLEAECAKGGLRCDVVTLYNGGAYHLYRYRRYTDVRLVLAPEYAVAAFGGDPDNFEFPRHALDIAFFRVYENGKPLALTHWLKWTTAGVKENELVFMSGHPGSTARSSTLAQLEFFRDVQYPLQLKWRETALKALKQFAAQSPGNTRITESRLRSLENSQKAQKGYYAALLDKQVMAAKTGEEKALRSRLVAADPGLDGAWTNIAAAMNAQRQIFAAYQLLERLQGFDSELAAIARNLVRVTAERQKPNSERLREYRESALVSLEQQMFSPAPIHDSLEKQNLAVALSRLRDELGRENTAVRRVLGNRAPTDAAAQYVDGTKLKDVAVRKSLYQGGWEAVNKSDDPLIALMRDIDAEARSLRQHYDDEVDAVVRREGGRIAEARFRVQGPTFYPDATFTLRLSYGAVRGYQEDGRGSVAPKGTTVPFFTTLAGAFNRERKMGSKPPYQLPPTWKAAKARMKLDTPLDFVSTADSIGGNSGSPIVNTRGELVGINFDRNMQGLGRNFYYSEEGMRHIAVDARGIIEALRNIYRASGLANELVGMPPQ